LRHKYGKDGNGRVIQGSRQAYVPRKEEKEEEQSMSIETFSTNHLVKQEDLTHHGTLYAGRTAEWFVEAGFIAAAKLTKPEAIVCVKIHGMHFSKPVGRGEILCLENKIV